MKKHTKSLLLTMPLVMLAVVSAIGQSAVSSVEKPPADDNTPLNLKATDFNMGRMYTRLLTFKYNPSQRDMFISSTVTTPFVTEEEDIEQGQDPDKIKEAKTKISEVITSGVKLSGVAFNKFGGSYVITTDGQIVKVGDYILFTPNNKARAAINAAGSLANEGGGSIKVEKYKFKTGLLLQVVSVDSRSATIKVPWDEDITLNIPYDKDLRIDEKPKPAPSTKKDDF